MTLNYSELRETVKIETGLDAISSSLRRVVPRKLQIVSDPISLDHFGDCFSDVIHIVLIERGDADTSGIDRVNAELVAQPLHL